MSRVILSERGTERLSGSPKSDGDRLGSSLGQSSGVVSEESAFLGIVQTTDVTMSWGCKLAVILSERGPERTRGPKERSSSLG